MHGFTDSRLQVFSKYSQWFHIAKKNHASARGVEFF
jgi:hypothetical protein